MGFLGEGMVGLVLDVCDLSVIRSGKVVIKDVCLTVDEGEFLGIVGPNGSGKSTFLLAVLGLLRSDSCLLYTSPSPRDRG